MYLRTKHKYVVLGDWNAICDRCQFRSKAKLDKIKNDGQQPGLKVCPKCQDIRHPQDFVQAKPDAQSAAWTRPEPDNRFVGPCSRTAVVGLAKVGCAVVGWSETVGHSVKGAGFSTTTSLVTKEGS